MQSYFSTLFQINNNKQPIIKSLTTSTILLTTSLTLIGYSLLSKYLTLRQKRLQRKKHRPPPPQSWALCTGGTKGIGFAFIIELLKRNHRVILTGTSQASVDLAIKDLQQMYPESKIIGIVASLEDTRDFLQKIKNLVQNQLDSIPAVVILNASAEDICPLEVENEVSLINMLQSNTVTNPALIRYFLSEWSRQQQQQHSTPPSSINHKQYQNYILGCSSMTSFVPIPYGPAYTATRVFQSTLYSLLSERFVSPPSHQALHDIARIVLVETPVVWTKKLQTMCESREEACKTIVDPIQRTRRTRISDGMTNKLKKLSISPMSFANQVLKEAFDDGELEIVVGHRIRFIKWLSTVFGIKMGWTQDYLFWPHNAHHVDKDNEWVKKEMMVFSGENQNQ
jgi:short-subunit dehydrogenase